MLEECLDDDESRAVLALLVVGLGEPDLERRVAGEAGDGRLVLLLGLVEPAEPAERLGEVPVEEQVIRREPQGVAEGSQGIVRGHAAPAEGMGWRGAWGRPRLLRIRGVGGRRKSRGGEALDAAHLLN